MTILFCEKCLANIPILNVHFGTLFPGNAYRKCRGTSGVDCVRGCRGKDTTNEDRVHRGEVSLELAVCIICSGRGGKITARIVFVPIRVTPEVTVWI